MSAWYYRVTGQSDWSEIPNFIDYFEKELVAARLEMSLKGKSLEKHAAELPGIVEQRFSQLQEIESVLEYLNIRLSKERSAEFKKFLEAYNRALSSRDAEKYVDGVSSIVDLTILVNEVALLRNRYLAIMKGLDAKNYMISNITKLKVVGLDDASI
jgi:hypothetical protein